MTTGAFSRNVSKLFSKLKLVTDNHSNGRRLLYYQAVVVKPQNIEKKSIFMFSKNTYVRKSNNIFVVAGCYFTLSGHIHHGSKCVLNNTKLKG